MDKDELAKMDEMMADKNWPNSIKSRKELDNALEAGLESGVSDKTFDEIVEEVLSRKRG